MSDAANQKNYISCHVRLKPFCANEMWDCRGCFLVFHQSTQHHMVVRSTCIPPVNTAPHGGQINVHYTSSQINVHSTSQHSTTWWSDQRAFHQQHSATWWSDQRAFHQSTQHAPHGGQIIVHSTISQINVHSTSQHSTTWWSDQRAFHQSTQYHMVVRSTCITPVNTVRSDRKLV